GLMGWGTAILLLGIVEGSFTEAMIDAADGMPDELSAVLCSEALVESNTALLGALGINVAAAVGVYAMQTRRTEEAAGRPDTVLATPVGRISWSLSHVLVIAIGIVLIAAVTGLGTGLAAAVVTEDAALVGDILLSHLAVVPAALAGLGLCTAVFGWLPRLMAPAGWVLVAVMGILDMFAELLDLPDWFRALSPLHHLA